MENKKAYDELLKELKMTHKLEPINQKRPTLEKEDTRLSKFKSTPKNLEESSSSVRTNSDAIANPSAYTELIELTQRKFLRQMAIFTDTATSRPFPRLFCLDIDPADLVTPALSSSTPSDSKSTSLCLRALCEADSGWHPVGSSLTYKLIADIPENHYAYLYRILSLIKHSTMSLSILHTNRLEDVLTYIEDDLEDSSPKASSTARARTLDQTQLFNFRESYNAVKAYVMGKLALEQPQKSAKTEIVNNPNRIEYFGLSRCSLPSGKVAWLCEEHSKDQYVQQLTSVETSAGTQFQNDEYSAILLEELKKYKS